MARAAPPLNGLARGPSIRNHLTLSRLCVVAVIALLPLHSLAQGSVTISGTKDPASNTYRYSLSNNTQKAVVGVVLGNDPTKGDCGLSSVPVGWTAQTGTPTSSGTAPNGWTFDAFIDEDTGRVCVEWRSGDRAVDDLQPASVTTDFVISTQAEDPAYLDAIVTIIFADSTTLKTKVS